MIRVYSTGVGLFTLLSIGIFLLNTHLYKERTPASILSEHMTGVTAQRFDEEGRLIQVLKIKSWEHPKASAVSMLILPHLTIYSQDGSQWEMSAQKGESTHQGKQGTLKKLDLSDKVIITRQTADPWLTLKTNTLTFLPLESRAFTNDPVLLEGPEMQTQAIGMRASLEHHLIEFLHSVHTSYTPHAKALH